MLYKVGAGMPPYVWFEFYVIPKICPARNIYRNKGKRLVHGKYKISCSIYTLFVSKRFLKGFTENKTEILKRVVVIDFYVAFCSHLQIKSSMPGKIIEHVTQKRNGRLDIAMSQSFDCKIDSNIRFSGFPSMRNFSCLHDFTISLLVKKWKLTKTVKHALVELRTLTKQSTQRRKECNRKWLSLT